MDLERCKQCGRYIAHIKFPWDAGDDIDIYCLDCKPITKEEKEFIEFAEYQAKKRKSKSHI